MRVKTMIEHMKRHFRFYLYIGLGSTLGIVVFGFISYMMALDRVVLQVDGRKIQLQTLSSDVSDLLREKRITLKEGDQVQPTLQTPITENMVIKVIRSFPVKIKAAGNAIECYTISQPVREVLKQANINYDNDDKVFPGLDTNVKPNQQIKVVKVDNRIFTKQVITKPGTEYIRDKEMERGEEKVVRQGKSGLDERRIKVVYEDGREVNRYRLQERIVKPVVNKLVARGTRIVVRTLETSRGSYRYIEARTMIATAYYPGPESCGKYAAWGETYTGKKAGFGLVAVDPRVIKLGTKLYIEGYGRAEAADIGGAIKGNRIDLCFETYREAAMYGTKRIKVYILDEPRK